MLHFSCILAFFIRHALPRRSIRFSRGRHSPWTGSKADRPGRVPWGAAGSPGRPTVPRRSEGSVGEARRDVGDRPEAEHRSPTAVDLRRGAPGVPKEIAPVRRSLSGEAGGNPRRSDIKRRSVRPRSSPDGVGGARRAPEPRGRGPGDAEVRLPEAEGLTGAPVPERSGGSVAGGTGASPQPGRQPAEAGGERWQTPPRKGCW